MRILKTLKEGRENYCAFISWPLFFFLPQLATSQVSQIPFNAANTSIGMSFPDPNEPSVATLDLSWWAPVQQEMQVSKLNCILEFSQPLHDQAALSLLALPGDLGYGSIDGAPSLTLSEDRTCIHVEVAFGASIMRGERLFSIVVDNQGEDLSSGEFTVARMGIVEVILIEPGKTDSEIRSQIGNPYPNPANHIIHIPLTPGTQTASITASNGVLVKHIKVEGMRELSLRVAGLPEGHYFVRLNGNHSALASRRFLVQH